MTATKQFIEDAIEGGWNSQVYTSKKVSLKQKTNLAVIKYEDGEWDGTTKWVNTFHISEILLDPKAWQAVGKTRGWDIYIAKDGETLPNTWFSNWHAFIDALAEGKDINSALPTKDT